MKLTAMLPEILAAILCLFAPDARADAADTATGWLVFGDSQSFVVQDTQDARQNWPHLAQSWTGQHFFNMSRGGRRLADGHVAEYLRMADIHRLNQQADGVIIALGSLDALFRTDPLPALRDAIAEAEARELRVLCLLPPNNHVMQNAPMRETLAAVCPDSVDLSLYLGPDDMVDPVHFGAAGHLRYAGVVFWALAIRGLL